MKIQFNLESKMFDKNQAEELIQRIAWKLVRSASDRLGDNKGDKKREWCIAQMEKEFPGIGSNAEEYVRAAYIQYKTERG